MIHPPSKPLPFLKGQGAEIECVVPILAEIFTRDMHPDNNQHRDMADGLVASSRIDAILNE